MDRRKVLAGMGGMAAGLVSPAWAQFSGAIKPQSDPYAQVDPYDDPRNGFSNGTSSGQALGRSSGPSPAPSPFENGPSAISAVTAEEEQQEIARASKAMGARLAKYGGMLKDSAMQNAINDLSMPLFRKCDRSGLPWEIIINREPGFQALAYGGGKMLMYPETIAVCDHPGELAAIIAHEMGHNVFSHSTKRLQTAELLIQQAKGGHGEKAQQNLQALNMDPLDALMKSYGRENEFEADGYIITMFERLGVHPGHAITVYDKMMRYYGSSPDEDNSLFSTHPGTVERIRYMADRVRAIPAIGQEFKFSGWSVLKAGLPTPSAFRNG